MGGKAAGVNDSGFERSVTALYTALCMTGRNTNTVCTDLRVWGLGFRGRGLTRLHEPK